MESEKKSGRGKTKGVKDKDTKSVKDKNIKDKPDVKDVKEKGKKVKKSPRTQDENKTGRKSTFEESTHNIRESINPTSVGVENTHRRSYGSQGYPKRSMSVLVQNESFVKSALGGGHKNQRGSLHVHLQETESSGIEANDSSSSKDALLTSSTSEKVSEKVAEEVLEDFWATAWAICFERFHETTGPISASIELRDTWLRIMEVQWMDLDLTIGNRHVVPSNVFIPDESPLPLQYDSWSKGGLEIMPHGIRKSSVLDPFMRDDKSSSVTPVSVAEKVTSPHPTINKKPHHIDDPTREKHWNQFFFSSESSAHKPTRQLRNISTTASAKVVASKLTGKMLLRSNKVRPRLQKTQSSPTKKIHIQIIGDGERLEIRSDSSGNDEDENEAVKQAEEDLDYYESDYVPKPQTADYIYPSGDNPPMIISSVDQMSKASWETLFKAKALPSKSSVDINKAYEQLGITPWSPSDCGGRRKSGVFRLIHESTTEVIRRTNPSYQKPNKPKGVVYAGDRRSENPTQFRQKSIVERLINPVEVNQDLSAVDILKYTEAHQFTDLKPASFTVINDNLYPSKINVKRRSYPRESPVSNFYDGDDEGGVQSEYEITRSRSLPANPQRLTSGQKLYVTHKVQSYNTRLQRQLQLKDIERIRKEESVMQALANNPPPPPPPEIISKKQIKMPKFAKLHQPPPPPPPEISSKKQDKMPKFQAPDDVENEKRRLTLKRHSQFVRNRFGFNKLVNKKEKIPKVHEAEEKLRIDFYMKDDETMGVRNIKQ